MQVSQHEHHITSLSANSNTIWTVLKKKHRMNTEVKANLFSATSVGFLVRKKPVSYDYVLS